jgi:RND family efflux transporter MFP subunit
MDSIDSARIRIVLLALFFLILPLAGCERETSDQEVVDKAVRPAKLMKIGGLLTDKSMTMTSKTRAAKRADLAFRVPGLLIDLPVKEGEQLKKGQLVARLDPTDYQSRLREAEGRLAEAKAKRDYDIAEYQRYVKVKRAEPGAVSDSMINLKRAARKVSLAEVQAAEAAVAEAKNQLAYATLRAPFAGIVGKRYVDNHEFVVAKQPIVHLQDFSRIEILLDLPELMVAPIRRTEPNFFAQFVSAPDRRFPLQVKEFATQADPATQTYRMILVMPAPSGVRILPGMTASVIIEFPLDALSETEVVVPTIALFANESGQSNVWVVAPKTNEVHKRPVVTGALTGNDQIMIEQGLSPGEAIVVSGVNMLREGMTVRPFDSSALREE